MASHERVVRAVPLWLMRDYLVDAGGTVVGDGRVTGNGWAVSLEQVEDFHLGSLKIGQVRFYAEGDDAALAALMAVMEDKLVRAGG